MTKTALLADVHCNLPALEAVLADAYKTDATRAAFLGDVLGFGPQPVECMERLERECEPALRLRGNYDYACTHEENLASYNLHVRKMLGWLRKILENAVIRGRCEATPALRWITELRERSGLEGAMLVHASPRDPLYEFIGLHHGDNAETLAPVFAMFAHLCFVGHTHIPGVMEQKPQSQWQLAADLGGRYAITPNKALINVGSVGQPRDEDPRACYAIFDGESVEWRRVVYDIEAVVAKMKSIDEIDPMHGERLRQGR
jgi:predicted phosphodiesterase